MASKQIASPNPQACLFCRSKHLKCGAERPTCARCQTNQRECIYVQSRRGLVGGRRKRTEQLVNASAVDFAQQSPPSNYTSHRHGVLPFPHPPDGEVHTPESDITAPVSLAEMQDSPVEEYFIEMYYQHIHPAHPFIIPRQLYKQNPDILPSSVKHVMAFAASHVTTMSGAYRDEACSILNTTIPSDVFKVQAYLLLTITSYARSERGRGDKALRKAVETAYEIGLHDESFAKNDNPILRESWRRTWWELFSVSCLLSVLTPTNPRPEIPPDRQLPCQESEYENLHIRTGPLPTFDEMHDRLFTNHEYKYSSFAYRVESASILAQVLNHAEEEQLFSPSPNTANGLSASIKSYLLSAPRYNAQITDYGSDEMLHCATMTINLASILLHFPRSALATSRTFPTICSTSRHASTNNSDQNTHRSAALSAADSITRLLIDRPEASMRKLSPCFSCALAFSVTTQLSAFCVGPKDDRAHCLREYIQLSLSALDQMGENWPVARQVKGQLVDFAREILGKRKRTLTDQTGPESSTPNEPTSDSTLMLAAPLENEMWLQDFIDDPVNFAFNPT